MKIKTIIAIAALLTLGQGAWADVEPTIDDLYNSEKGYYEIPDAAALNKLATYVNAGNKCNGLTFKVTKDITFAAPVSPETSNYTPIGSCADENEAEVGSFQGTFDGANYTISGIRVYQPTGTYIGLFGNSYGATIKNVRLSDCQFTGQAIVGGIVAAEKSSTPKGIDNCRVDDDVKVTAVGKDTDGGFVGGIAGMYQYATISNCSSLATVSGSQYVGDIVGLLTLTSSRSGNVSNCNSNDVMVGRVWIDEDNDEEGYPNEYIPLINDADNSAVISAYNGQTDNVIFLGRKLSKDDWNTLCLPFLMDSDQIAASSLNGATIKELNASESNLAANGTLTLNFTDASSITAGNPYIVKWASGVDISNPVFTGVTINAAAPTAVSFTNNANAYGDCQFVGQYSPFSITDGNKNEIIMLGSGSKLGYSKNARTLKCFRAHFYVPANGGGTLARAFVMDFGDGETTGIIDATADQRSASATYTLDGRRINDQPTQKGMYIQNGRKVIIK